MLPANEPKCNSVIKKASQSKNYCGVVHGFGLHSKLTMSFHITNRLICTRQDTELLISPLHHFLGQFLKTTLKIRLLKQSSKFTVLISNLD